MRHALPAAKRLLALAMVLVAVAGIGRLGGGGDTVSAAVPSGYSHFYDSVVVTDAGSNVQLWANAIPNHGSPYFYPGDPMYEAYNGSNPNWQQNPNHIGEQSLLFTIPADPQPATVHQATPLGPIGIALNGVPFFNQYAGPGQPLTNEINSFDQYNGHPQMEDLYHYHFLPLALVTQEGPDALLGYLLDGYPVYGPVEDGVELTSADLDQYHGHFGPTADYPQGIYHYHITTDSPYINGTGFYGTPGTVVLDATTPTPTASPSPTPTPTPAPTATPTPSPAPTTSPTPTPSDSDGDGVDDAVDDCPAWANPTQALPAWTVPAGDSDCDGYPDSVQVGLIAGESTIGTDAAAHCAATPAISDEPGPDAWPPDFNDNQLVNVSDWLSFNAHLFSSPPSAAYDARWDLNGNGLINISDLLQLNQYMFKRCDS